MYNGHLLVETKNEKLKKNEHFQVNFNKIGTKCLL